MIQESIRSVSYLNKFYMFVASVYLMTLISLLSSLSTILTVKYSAYGTINCQITSTILLPAATIVY